MHKRCRSHAPKGGEAAAKRSCERQENESMRQAKTNEKNRSFDAALVGLAACLAVLLLGAVGCEGNKKSALTEAEIERLTFAQKPSRPDALVVSGEEITCDSITDSSLEQSSSDEPTLREQLLEQARRLPLEPFMQWARPRAQRRLNNEITGVVLYKRAQRELGEKVDDVLDQMAEKELRRFVLEHGGNNAEADEALREMGRTRSTFIEWKKEQMLAQYAITSRFSRNRPVTHSELLQYYDRMKDKAFFQRGLVQFRLIDIQLDKVELSDPNEDLFEKAEALAQELAERIEAGEDFGALAKQYSHGHRREFGGLWKPRDPEALARPYDVLAEKARDMKPGEVAGPIRTPERIFIMRLEKQQKKGYQPLGEVQDIVAEQIVLDRRREALQQLDAEVAQQTALANTDSFVTYCLESLYRTAQDGAGDEPQP